MKLPADNSRHRTLWGAGTVVAESSCPPPVPSTGGHGLSVGRQSLPVIDPRPPGGRVERDSRLELGERPSPLTEGHQSAGQVEVQGCGSRGAAQTPFEGRHRRGEAAQPPQGQTLPLLQLPGQFSKRAGPGQQQVHFAHAAASARTASSESTRASPCRRAAASGGEPGAENAAVTTDTRVTTISVAIRTACRPSARKGAPPAAEHIERVTPGQRSENRRTPPPHHLEFVRNPGISRREREGFHEKTERLLLATTQQIDATKGMVSARLAGRHLDGARRQTLGGDVATLSLGQTERERGQTAGMFRHPCQPLAQ